MNITTEERIRRNHNFLNIYCDLLKEEGYKIDNKSIGNSFELHWYEPEGKEMKSMWGNMGTSMKKFEKWLITNLRLKT